MTKKLWQISFVEGEMDREALAKKMAELCDFYQKKGLANRPIGQLIVQWPIPGIQDRTIFFYEDEDENE